MGFEPASYKTVTRKWSFRATAFPKRTIALKLVLAHMQYVGK